MDIYGIHVCGESGDGDSRILKTQKVKSGLSIKSNIFEWFHVCIVFKLSYIFFKKYLHIYIKSFKVNLPDNEPLCVQDTIHLATKLRNAFLNENKKFQIGDKVANPNHLRQLIGMFPRSLHLLSLTDLDGKDRMNFQSVEKIISSKVILQLSKLKDTEATIIFLRSISEIIDSYQNRTITPNERIFKMAYSTFFFRILRAWVKAHDNLKLSESFISSNAYVCLELNFHALIIGFGRYQKDPEKNPFLPWLWSSQPCEKFFRMARSMTSTFHTKINFDTTDFIGHMKRIQFLQTSMATLESSHQFPREAHRKLGVGDSTIRIEPLSNEEISEIVLSAKDKIVTDTVYRYFTNRGALVEGHRSERN